MKNPDSIQPTYEKPQKITKTRLYKTLEELNLQYEIDGDGGNFDIIIHKPQEHIEAKEALVRKSVLNDSHQTEFDKENIMPLIRKINMSLNFCCDIKESTADKYVISVSKKF